MAATLAASAGLGALLVSLGSCSNTTRLPAPFIFNTPGDMELVCFDRAPENDDRVVLPYECCTYAATDEHCPPVGRALRHALVTQTARGEVAALDLENSKVLDSERRVPGYTFVDVGGLPSAIAVPHSQLGKPGPQWTYVAGRQANSIRAIATCRFRLGKECGPELADEIQNADVTLLQQTELQLPEAPQDVLLDEDGKVLWVSLPKAGMIARIDLGEPAEDSADGVSFVRPFAVEEGSVLPRPPTYFVVPGGISLEPELPEAEQQEYQATCGLGFAFEPSRPALPIAPRAASTGQALPTRMRMLPRDKDTPDSAPPLLLVADVGQAVLHAFAVVDGQLAPRAVLPVGAPLRDFVVTPAVPSVAPPFEALVDQSSFAYEESVRPPDDKRYVYAIDARDGSVMVFDLSFSGEVPALHPLEAPLPPRHEGDLTRDARDRLRFEGSTARALEIIDTRHLAQNVNPDSEYRDPLYCGKWSREALESERDAKKKAHAPKGEVEELNEAIDWTKAAERADVLRGVFLVVASTDGRISLIDVHDLDLQCRAQAACNPGNPGPTDEPGDDVPPDPIKPAEGYDGTALAVRRHAPRLLTATPARALLSSRRQLATLEGEPVEDAGAPDAQEPDEGEPEDPADAGEAGAGEEQAAKPLPCLSGYYRPDEDDPVCVISDPWQARDLTWSVSYEGAITDVPSALLERDPQSELVTLWGPQGYDLCARGANAADGLTFVVTASPDPDVDDCKEPTSGHEPLLHVVEAYQDHLVLAPTLLDAGAEPEPEPPPEEPEEMDAGSDGGPRDGGAQARDAAEPPVDLDELIRCYPQFLGGEIRLRDQYTVKYNAYVYLHPNHAGDGGVCVADPEIDSRFSSRVGGPDWVFQDLWLAFQLEIPADAEREDIAPVVQLTQQSSFLTVLNIDSASGRADALPSRLRFFPEFDDLFIVDGASQGMRRYQLEPFQAYNTRFR